MPPRGGRKNKKQHGDTASGSGLRALRKHNAGHLEVDTPEVLALGAGFARQAQFDLGYDDARLFGNKLAMRSTAVPEGEKAPMSFLASRYDYSSSKPFLQPVTGVNLQKELGLSRHHLDTAFDKNITKSDKGFQHSSIHGLEMLRAYKYPPAARGAEAIAAIYERNAPALQTRQDAKRALRDWQFEAGNTPPLKTRQNAITALREWRYAVNTPSS